MYCKNKKCRDEKIIKKRTLRSKDRTKRETVCPKCNIKYNTIELFENDLEKIINEKEKQVAAYKKKFNELKEKYDTLKNAISVIKNA